MNGWALLALLLVLAAIGAAIGAAIWRAGQRAEKSKQLEAQTNDLLEAADIRDRLRRDDDFAKRVRGRFTR
ncbi:MAG: hypothetical protein Q8K65_08795 [Alphaproteobacteria bacterium]|nr:hypothetical protein [Alphaproteobacteria bacterium]